MKQKMREGYSLMELMIAIAISSIVLLGVVGLLGFGTRNMRLTQACVDLQNQAKDAINHMSAYVMEGSRVTWDEDSEILSIIREKTGDDNQTESTEYAYYWKKDNGIYFLKAESEPDVLTADKKHLLSDHITHFECEEKKNEKSGKKYLHVSMKLTDDDIEEFECNKDIMMRNQ